MADEGSHEQMPNPRELPVAMPGIAGILFHYYNERLSIDEAPEECRKFGAKDVGHEQIEEAYSELSRLAEKLNTVLSLH